jgi:hypothetical protein
LIALSGRIAGKVGILAVIGMVISPQRQNPQRGRSTAGGPRDKVAQIIEQPRDNQS